MGDKMFIRWGDKMFIQVVAKCLYRGWKNVYTRADKMFIQGGQNVNTGGDEMFIQGVAKGFRWVGKMFILG